MGFLAKFREKTKKVTLPLLLAAAGAVGAARPVVADELAVLASAHVNGMHGSEYHDRVFVRNPSGETLSGKIYLTERGASFDAASDPSFTYSLPAGTTLTLDDLHAQLLPGVDGAGTLRLVPDAGQAAPWWRATIYNKDGENEFGAFQTPFDPDVAGYRSAGTTLSTMLSAAGYRDNPFVQSGPDGMTGRWVYTNSAGGNRTEVAVTLAPNTTFQYTGGVTQLLGFAPEPGGQLDLLIDEGEGRSWLGRNNNASNDLAYDEFSVTSTVDTSAAAYVGKWLPESAFYLANHEIRAMINGGMGTRSYTPDMAEILVRSTANTNGTTAAQLEQWLKEQVDGNLANGELWGSWDPALWDNDAAGDPAWVFYGEPSGGLSPFPLTSDDMQAFYDLIRDEFLVRYVAANADLYGGTLGGDPDMNFNPTWNTQDPN